MSVKALQEYTRISKYARHNQEEGRRETWDEQVNRVMDMHKIKYNEVKDEIKEELDFIDYMLKRKRVLGSQRALQFGGSAILDKNARLYNCAFSYVDRERFFAEFMYLCLCGVGAGFSVQYEHVSTLPDIKKRTKSEKTFEVEDSIEGWADAIGALMNSYFVGSEFTGYKLKFDFSKIRPAGAIIKSSGAKAPGPDGLKRSMEQIEILMDRCIENGQEKLRPIDAYDVLMHASDAVVSGGIRRAATVCLFSKDDLEMRNAKTGKWFIENPQRGRSNNSVLLLRDKTTKEEFEEIMQSVKEFGEPGFIWADDIDSGFNPCLSGDSLIKTDKGEVTIKDICENPTDYKAFSMDGDGNFSYQDIQYGLKTRENSNLIKIEFDDGTELKLTPDHRVFTKNRGYVKASELKEVDEVVSYDFDMSKYEESSENSVNEFIDQSKWTNKTVVQHCI